MLHPILRTLVKVAVASLVVGTILAHFGITAEQLMREFGLSADRLEDYARKGFAEQSPGAVRAFLGAWFETIGHMRNHRAQAIEIVRRTAEVSPGVATRDYDELMGMFNPTGRFSAKALDVLARSFVEMGSLPREPDMRALVTEQYLPGPK